jgi:hypothetical protein
MFVTAEGDPFPGVAPSTCPSSPEGVVGVSLLFT